MTTDPTAAEKRIFRSFSLPLSAFETMQALKRQWQMDSNAAVVSRLLREADAQVQPWHRVNPDRPFPAPAVLKGR